MYIVIYTYKFSRTAGKLLLEDNSPALVPPEVLSSSVSRELTWKWTFCPV